MENKKRLYIDMDGTLAEWRSFKYELTSLEDVQNASKLIYQKLNEENYFYNLKPQENVVNAVRNIVQNHKDSIDVYILSASVSDVTTNDKNRWLDRYLPDIDSEHRIFTKDGEDKRNFITGGVMENDYLLDDRTLNLTQWVQSGKGIKLLNGQNHTTKTWKGDMVSYDTTPQLLVGKLLSIINENVHVQDEQPFHTEQTITIKPITTNAFENIEVWENERKALQEQYLTIVRDKNFRALEWYTDMGGHYIFHPSVKSSDWQLSFIDNKGIPTSDSQFKDEDIGIGKRWIDPIAEFPHSRIDKPITIKALFENPNREREIMAEQERSVEDYITSMQKEQLYPKYAVLQLAEGLDETHYRRFEPLENLKERGVEPNGDNYELVYFNVNDPNNTKVNLDSVYEHFNANEPRPSNYYGHSLSVSDVVLVSENGTDIKAYYCDDIGFSELDDNFLTKKIQDRFNTGTTIKDELDLLLQEKNDNGLSETATDRLNYLHDEYTVVFNMANKRAVLEETEKLNTVFDYELLYGGTQNEDSITVFNEQLNRAFIKPTIFNENSADELQKIVDKSYFEALADKDLHKENLNYENISSFQVGDRVWLGNGHSVEIMEAQAIDHTDLPLPTRYKAEWHIDDSNYFDPEFPNETEPTTTFLLSDVDVVERNGKTILEPPVEEVTKETEELPVETETYKYYSTQRPIGMGTYPRENSLDIVNYDTRSYVEAINREAWGEITYSQPLSERQISDYELVADPSIKLTLEQRLQNDDLLNAQDLIEEIESVGGVVDEYGNVTVYHRTDEKSVARIKGTGIMIAKEDGLFFSTKENGQNEGYGEAVVKLSIPVEKLVLDDMFSDEVHLRYPLENTRRLNVSDYLVNDMEIREVTHGEERDLIGQIATANSYRSFGRESVYEGEEYEILDFYSAKDGYIYDGDIQSDENCYRLASVTSVSEARAYNEDTDDLGIIISVDNFNQFFSIKELGKDNQEQLRIAEGGKDMFKDISSYKTDITNYESILHNHISLQKMEDYLGYTGDYNLSELEDYLDDNTELWSYSVDDLEEAVNNNTPVIRVSDGNEERYFEIPEEAVSDVRELIAKEKETNKVTYFVAEAMEFHTLGEMYEDIPTIEEAIKIFEKIPASRHNMGNGIGAMVNDWEYSLYENGAVDTLEYYEDSIKENETIKKAIHTLNNHFSKENEHENKNYTLSERYTEAMKMAGFEFLDMETNRLVFKTENSSETFGFDSWRGVGNYLEDVVVTDEAEAKNFDELIHPQGRIQFVTQNLDGEGIIDGTEVNVYPDMETALKAYLDASIVDGKAIGIKMSEQNRSLHAIEFSHFDTVDMNNHMHSLPQIKLLAIGATVNELEEIENIYKTISTELMKDNVYQKLQTSFNDLSTQARVDMTRQNSEWGSWGGRIANTNRPQDYVDVDITGYNTHHLIACNVNVVRDNSIVDRKSFTAKTDVENFETSLSTAYATVQNEFVDFLKEAVDKLNTDIEFPFELYSPYSENSINNHYELLNNAGYESFPSLYSSENDNIANEIFEFYEKSDEAETDSLEQIKEELQTDNGKQYRADIYDYVQEHLFELSEEERNNGLELISKLDDRLETVARTEFEQSRPSVQENMKAIMQTLVDVDMENNNGALTDDMRKVLDVQKYSLDNENKIVDEFNISDVDILNKLDNMNGSEISENVYHFIMDNNYNDSISSRVLELLKEDEFKDIVTDVDLYNNDLIYMTAIKDVLNNGNQVVTDTQIGWGNIKLLSEVQNVKNANLVADIKGIEFYNRVDNPNLLITYNENYKIDTDENIKNACNRIFNNYYSDDLEEHLVKQSNEWSKNNISPHREDNSITLHIKYQEPIRFNGFTVKSDTITFDNQEELEKFVKGEVAYDTLDNAVRKKDNEILLYADNKKGEVIWEAEKTQQSDKDIKPSNGKEVEKMAETTKAVETGNEELSPKDLLMKQLADGIKDTLDSEKFADWCKKQGRLYYNNYSLRNAMLTYLQKPEASYVCGYEKWKEFGRQVQTGAKGIKVLAPTFVKEYGAKGSLLASIRKACNEQLKKDPKLEYATFRLGQSKLSFNMYKNGLYDVKVGEDVVMAHITSDEMRKFLDKSVIGKVPAYYNAITVFDVKDTTDEVEFLWVKDNYKKDELVLDDNGNPIKNRKGQFKILNSEERKARFTADIDMTIKEADTQKMEILYDTLKTISNNKGIPLTEEEPSKDETLAGGALGYYRHPTAEHDKGNIVISSDLSITDKVSVAFHEMAHSDLHADIDWLKDEMDLDAGEKVTRQMKETQAEAVAYMTASNFGIETEHKSFEYIANWSNGRELKDLEKSLDVIYKESRQLMKDIEAELDTRGLTLAMEVKDKTPFLDEVKATFVSQNKEYMINAMRNNEIVQKTAFEDFKSLTDETQKGIVKEQIALSHKIDEQINKLNEHVEAFEKSTERQEQTSLQYQIKSDIAKIDKMQNRLNDLSEERVTVVLEKADETKSDMKALYASSPLKAMEQLQKENEQMKDLTKNDLKYLATSKFISREYSKFLGADNQKFIELATKQLANLNEAMSKNKTAVEIAFCEQWGDEPIFKEGTIAHPKIANKIIAQAEKQTEAFKAKAESEDDYYPYSKCDITVYSVTGKDKMTVLNTKIDIGDGEQKDLTDHLTQVCAKGKEKQAVLENFTKSTRERGETLLLTPQLENNTRETAKIEERGADKTLSMSDWKSELNITSDKTTQDKEEHEKDNSEKERS